MPLLRRARAPQAVGAANHGFALRPPRLASAETLQLRPIGNPGKPPQVRNYGLPGQGMLLREGMTIAIEPMVLVGTPKTDVLDDQWTVISADKSLTAHYEHTVAVTKNGPMILTRRTAS